ncbi:glycoside hydrolase family 38 C-terminal domain-containing protein [Tunturiibacter empetritectus]|uniref:Alpha-mannosidase n=1 Tax=Tunturiibacter lichenicola TaxID=2051959 RepID=A0A852VCE5_9BACT|nr:glycoside hydrolase family 38 C-terminal domain-containing protein [Edaphobacter lichenicola]NYF90543.1 alpha-mannosidase [Edaphobacter lichenicola]
MRLRQLSLALLLSCAPLLAQSFTPVREQKNLSPAAVAKLNTLETLNSLPAGDWRFHAGDIPHGESTTLDDSSWTLVQPKSKAPHEAVWYRREIEVPKTLNGYDITGSRISFQFRSDANGAVPEIIYFNGKRVALGEDLEPIVLFEPANPGDKILVAVKLLQTVDDKTFSGVRLTIEPNPNATGATARPSPDDIRIQCIAAANLLPALPTPRKDLLPKVEEAVAAINTNALASADQAAFDRSLRHAQEILTTLHPVLAEAKIDLAGNSHIDAAWLWPKSETIDVVKRTFTTALQLMNEYPDYTFSQSAAQYTEWMAEKYPALNEQIRQRVKEGRWEIVGGMWVEPDLNLPDGESQVRQLLIGQRVFHDQYGVVARIGWNPDSFGYNWQTPQIYKRSGLDYFVTQKMHWNDTNQLPFRLFWWESPDGSKVLTYFPTDYVHDNVNPTRISADFAESADRNPGTTELLDLYGIGDHGGGPTRAMLDQADHWIAAGTKDHDAVPTMRYHTAQNYFTNVEKNLNPTSPTWDYESIAKGYTAPPAANGALGIPTWKDELYFEYHRGVYTTQAAHKRNMRTSEVATLDAEKLASLAWLDGQPYPNAELTENWKKITFNGFHDLAAGSGIAIIYKDAQREYTEVFHADKEITDNSLNTLSTRIDTSTKTGVPVLVYNAMAWPRSETVELHIQLPSPSETIELTDTRNAILLSQIVSHQPGSNEFTVLARVNEVPALGYTVLHAYGNLPQNADLRRLHKEQLTDLKYSGLSFSQDSSSYTLSTGRSHLQVRISKETGCITNLTTDSFPAHTYVAANPANDACANQLQTFKDTPKQYDAWNIDPGTLDGTMTPITTLDSIAITDNGPLRKTIRVTRSWQSSKFVQDISLDAGADTVRISNDIEWHETHVLLKAAFPLAATSPKATYEIPFGSIARPTTRNNSWEKAQFEVPAMRWADLGDDKQGLSILNDSKYGYDAAGNTLRITLLRSPTWPDAEADRGHQHFVYALYPHTGSWKQAQTVRRGYELNDPLKATQVFSHTGTLPAEHSFASIENPNVTLTAIKKAEDSDALVFRMYEWAGTTTEVKLHIPHGATYAIESNMMEKPEGDHLNLTNDTVTVPIKPYEILTLQAIYPTPTTAAK